MLLTLFSFGFEEMVDRKTMGPSAESIQGMTSFCSWPRVLFAKWLNRWPCYSLGRSFMVRLLLKCKERPKSNVSIETFDQIFFYNFAIFCQFKILKNILHFSFWQFYQLQCLQFLKFTISNNFEIFDNTDGCYNRSWLLSMLLVESTMWTCWLLTFQFMTIQLRVTLDSIRNSCNNVFHWGLSWINMHHWTTYICQKQNHCWLEITFSGDQQPLGIASSQNQSVRSSWPNIQVSKRAMLY